MAKVVHVIGNGDAVSIFQNKKIMHWTGEKGNIIIREKIKNGLSNTQSAVS